MSWSQWFWFNRDMTRFKMLRGQNLILFHVSGRAGNSTLDIFFPSFRPVTLTLPGKAYFPGMELRSTENAEPFKNVYLLYVGWRRSVGAHWWFWWPRGCHCHGSEQRLLPPKRRISGKEGVFGTILHLTFTAATVRARCGKYWISTSHNKRRAPIHAKPCTPSPVTEKTTLRASWV